MRGRNPGRPDGSADSAAAVLAGRRGRRRRMRGLRRHAAGIGIRALEGSAITNRRRHAAVTGGSRSVGPGHRRPLFLGADQSGHPHGGSGGGGPDHDPPLRGPELQGQ